jgi:hypothetical protein
MPYHTSNKEKRHGISNVIRGAQLSLPIPAGSHELPAQVGYPNHVGFRQSFVVHY